MIGPGEESLIITAITTISGAVIRIPKDATTTLRSLHATSHRRMRGGTFTMFLALNRRDSGDAIISMWPVEPRAVTRGWLV